MTSQLPAHLAHRQKRDLSTAAIGGISQGQGPHISITGNRFTLIDAAGNQRPIQTLYLDVCIIDANPVVSKIFYDPNKRYDPSGGDNSPPICFSDNGQGASAQASQPQNTSCQLCPWNAWGSAVSQMTGKQTKACNDVKKLAVVVPGMGPMPFLLRVPPATLKNLAQYTNTMKGHGVDLPDALTRLEFESQGVLKFTPVGYVDAQTAADSEAVWASNGTDVLLGKLDRPWLGQSEAQKLDYAQRQQIAPPPQPAPAAPAPFAPAPSPQFGAAPPPPPFGQPAAPAPFGSPPPGSSPAFPAPPAPLAPSPQAQPAVQEPPKQRKPRTPKTAPQADAQAPFVQTQGAPAASQPSSFPQNGTTSGAPFAGPAATGSPPSDMDIPPFLRAGGEETPPPDAPQNNFGMNPNPPAPDAGVQAALDAAFRLPT